MQITVSISDARVSRSAGDALITYSLGSCIGVAVWDPTSLVAGLLHFQLPTSTMDPERSRNAPMMFADTGLTWLLDAMKAAGANSRRLKVKIAGGAKMLDSASTFDIGRRNHTAIRKVLWQQGLFVDAEDCGGNQPRTMSIEVASGRVVLKSRGQTADL
ncbi:MAG: chemotaxis protein CheD [Phycisphaerae bacterium]